MKIKDIEYSSHFERAFRKLPKEIQIKAVKQEYSFREDCFNPKLKTHKLKGDLEGLWAFSIDYSYRILFRFVGKNTVEFDNAGRHSIYQ